MDKRLQREKFRDSVIERDQGRCALCGYIPTHQDELDAHHITDRNLIPFGGYVLPNGISVCTDRSPDAPNCHRKAESLHETGIPIPGYTPEDLYAKIKSSYWDAYHRSLLDHLQNQPRKLDLLWREFRATLAEELAACIQLECKSDETTWQIACEISGVNDPLIKIYGKGRFYAGGTDNGAKRCN